MSDTLKASSGKGSIREALSARHGCGRGHFHRLNGHFSRARTCAGDTTRVRCGPVAQGAGEHVGLLTDTQKKGADPNLLRLRALYVRNHGELRAAARKADPTGGFPQVLENVYVWMRLHPDLRPTSTLDTTDPVAVNVQNEKPVLISGKQKGPRSESAISINPHDPQLIIAASNTIAEKGGPQAQFFSLNGGAAWGQSQLPVRPVNSFHSDPTVNWTSDGTAWATTLGINASRTRLQLLSYRSVKADGPGKTWRFEGVISGNQQTAADKQAMCVDHGENSAHKDNIYVIWHNNLPAFVNRRTTDGWQQPMQVSGEETEGMAMGCDITTNSPGEVFAAWPDTGSKKLFFVKSVNGGKDFSSPTQITQSKGAYELKIPALSEKRGALIAVSMAAFRDATHDDVYVSWVDQSDARDWFEPTNDPLQDVKSTCTARIWFTRSTDGGKQWEPPMKINDPELASNATPNDQFNQRLAVNPTSGTLGVIYFDTQQDKDRKRSHLVFQASTDHGKSWSKPVTVTETMIDETAVNANKGNQYGDYNGITVFKDQFFPAWTNRAKGNPEQIFSSRITVTKDPQGQPLARIAKFTPIRQ